MRADAFPHTVVVLLVAIKRGAIKAVTKAVSPGRLTALAALAGVLAGIALHLLGVDAPAHYLWAATTALLLIPLTVSVLRTLLRRDLGVDAIALVSMAGALALREYLAGAVVALMLAGGNALEEAANRRARRELTALVERAPRIALVRRGDELEETPVEQVAAGDVVLVRAGEVVPVDGMVESDEAVVDESALTGCPRRRLSPRSLGCCRPTRSAPSPSLSSRHPVP
jgi:cation transport ATPase